ncbi:hypothetical protein [Methyloligella solikamskensis]|uniref:NADH dehydrogenase n=1 Tax=Methyloligella solikamskensis TaxID=1177756 RepID=A0ABW3JAE6_9HYPH
MRLLRRLMSPLRAKVDEIAGPLRTKLDKILASQGHSFAASRRLAERQLLLSGQLASFEVRRLTEIDTLADVEFSVTSQWGEDGIIEWLVQKLPGIDRSFVEFGVENFGEANARFLLQNRGWRGLAMDGSEAHMNHLRSETLYWRYDLVAECAFVTAENINALLKKHGFDGDLGILSVDIDGNDYWVLKAIDCVQPALLIAEINGVFGDRHAITIPYDPSFERLKAHHSGQYFGASLQAMIALAKEKGFTFLGTNSNGVNAFFVRDDLEDQVMPSIRTVKAWPARHRDARNEAGELVFTRGTAKADLVAEMPVYDIDRKTELSLGELFPLYSEDWQKDLTTPPANG